MAIYDVDVLYVGSVLSYTNDPVQVIYESKEEDTAADVVNINCSILVDIQWSKRLMSNFKVFLSSFFVGEQYLPDRVILDFGNVSHSGVTSGPVEDSMIQIRW